MPKILPKNKHFISVYAGDIEEDEHGAKEILYMSNGAPAIRFEDGTTVVYTWEELIENAIKEKSNLSNCERESD